MVDYREILRLLSLGYNLTQISESLHSSRNTIRDVRERADKIRLPLSEDVTNQMLYELLYPERLEKVNVWMNPDCEHIHKELARKGVNLKLLWTEYKVSCENAGRVPYSYTQFCDIYRSWARKTKATMRISHKPGDSMEVDWAGGTVPIVDPVTGVVTDAYLFIGVLPCSCYAYAELCNDMQSENWLMAHVHAYEYFDGVPRLLIPDNLKVGVTKNTRLETLINKSYMELADHYGTAVVPTRVEAPKDYRQKSVIGNLSLKRNKYGPFQTEKPKRFPITFHPRPQKWSRYSSLPFHFFSGTDSVFPVSSFSGRAS